MVCFAELLQPSLRTLYEDLSKESKKQQETLAQLKRSELDMTPDDMDRDAWCDSSAPESHSASTVTIVLFQQGGCSPVLTKYAA